MLAKRTELRPVPGMRRMVSAGEALNAEVIEAFQGGDRPLDRRRLRPDRDRRDHRDAPRRRGPRRLDGPAAARDRDPDRRGRAAARAPSSPTFFSRYLDGEPFAEEWWPTGDLVREDEDGYLCHEGRADDLILSAGYRIGPFEVESALLSHPAVAEAAAVAAPDAERGSVVRAIVVLRDGEPSDALVTELQEHVKQSHGALQVPAHRRVRRRAAEDELSGKIKRAELREAK